MAPELARRARPRGRALSPDMVDRLCWRAGFGPTPALRRRFHGSTVEAAVDWLLGPQGRLIGPAPTKAGQPLDVYGDDSDADLVLTWLDRMVRAENPFVERLTFFWHRHWANSKQAVFPVQLIVRQNALFRRYADLGRNQHASFHDLALAVGRDPSMLRYLTGEANVRGHPNENYAREVLELFCLGVRDDAGRPPYTEDDVVNAARAFSGWVIVGDQAADATPASVRSELRQDRFSTGSKRLFGQRGDWDDVAALRLILAQPQHPRYLIRKLWHEFIVSEPPRRTLDDLVRTYRRGGTRLRPVLRKILTNPRLFESPAAPNMVKPPVVYVAGVLRQLGRGITDRRPFEYLDQMGQVPYFPPNVSGWEYGLPWLNTNTALARFGFAADLLSDHDPVAPVESAQRALVRARQAVGTPWLAPESHRVLARYAATAPASTAEERRARQLVLRALLVAGPDAQVM